MTLPPAAPVLGPRPRGRVVFFLVLLAVGLSGTGLLMLGIPGFLWLALAEPFTGPAARVESGWAAALAISVIWPFFLPLAYLVLAGLVRPGLGRWAAVLGTTAAGSVLLAAALRDVW